MPTPFSSITLFLSHVITLLHLIYHLSKVLLYRWKVKEMHGRHKARHNHSLPCFKALQALSFQVTSFNLRKQPACLQKQTMESSFFMILICLPLRNITRERNEIKVTPRHFSGHFNLELNC